LVGLVAHWVAEAMGEEGEVDWVVESLAAGCLAEAQEVGLEAPWAGEEAWGGSGVALAVEGKVGWGGSQEGRGARLEDLEAALAHMTLGSLEKDCLRYRSQARRLNHRFGCS